MLEALLEFFLRIVLEFVFYGLSYWTGVLVLQTLFLGKIPLAPLITLGFKNPNKKKWNQIDWSIWLQPPGKGRTLKAECTCLVGAMSWAIAGVFCYFATR